VWVSTGLEEENLEVERERTVHLPRGERETPASVSAPITGWSRFVKIF